MSLHLTEPAPLSSSPKGPRTVWVLDHQPGPAGLRWFGRTYIKDNLIQIHAVEIFRFCQGKNLDPFRLCLLVFWHEWLHWKNPKATEAEVHWALKEHLEKENKGHWWMDYVELVQSRGQLVDLKP